MNEEATKKPARRPGVYIRGPIVPEIQEVAEQMRMEPSAVAELLVTKHIGLVADTILEVMNRRLSGASEPTARE